ncbi:MAG: hypothetical protein IPM18_06800 [Phycisphaerales bacterium]|nr:hypothetical protein [Phycisphaerales bacterium]
MAHDPFTTLGLAPGRWPPHEVRKRFLAARTRLAPALDDPVRYHDAQQALDDLHLAYVALRDPQRQDEILRQQRGGTPANELRLLIRASLEAGLLRHSRREAILARATELGINEFQAQLLIAQVQFGDEGVEPVTSKRLPRIQASRGTTRAWAGLAGVGLLALVLFLSLKRWLGV